MILIIHRRLNMLTRLDVSRLQGGEVDTQLHLFTVLTLDETVIAFNAQYFALDCLVLFDWPPSLFFICFSPAS